MKQFEIWLADLEPQRGTETGKVRPVLVAQTNYLNGIHPSTIICPITTNVKPQSEILRVHIAEGCGLDKDSDVMIDQVRAIDNRRLIRKIGFLPMEEEQEQIKKNLSILLGI